MPSNVVADSGKVCYRNVPGASEDVKECLSYGNFTGSTDGFGSPATALPITDSQSLSRTSTTGDNATDFGLSPAAPRNNSNDIATSGLVVLVQPSDTVAGDAISPTVQVEVQDAFGNRAITGIDGITIRIGANPSGGTLSGTTTVNAVNGVAPFSDLSIDKAGTGYTLVASALNLTGTLSAAFDITPGAASRLAFTVQPTETTVGNVISPAVRAELQDALGNGVTTATDSVTIGIGVNPSGGILSGSTTVDAVSGVATFSDLSIDKAGTGYALIASAPNLTGTLSAAFNITTVAPAQLAFISQPSNTTAGATISPAVQVEVRDATGNRIDTAADRITMATGVNPGTATLSGTTTVGAVNGVATFSDLSIDSIGVGFTLVASTPNLIGATSTAFIVASGPLNNTLGARCSVPQSPVPGAAESGAVETDAVVPQPPVPGAAESGAVETGAVVSALLLLLGMSRGTRRRY